MPNGGSLINHQQEEPKVIRWFYFILTNGLPTWFWVFFLKKKCIKSLLAEAEDLESCKAGSRFSRKRTKKCLSGYQGVFGMALCPFFPWDKVLWDFTHQNWRDHTERSPWLYQSPMGPPRSLEHLEYPPSNTYRTLFFQFKQVYKENNFIWHLHILFLFVPLPTGLSVPCLPLTCTFLTL